MVIGRRSQPTRLKLPRAVVAELDLQRGERPLAWARCRDGSWLVGTERALHRHDDPAWRPLPWQHIERADWRSDSDELSIVELADWGEPERRTDIVVEFPGQLLELLRERVTRSVLLSRFAYVVGKRGVNVVARRAPSGEGPVAWSYVVTAGLDPADPRVQKVASATLVAARAELQDL
ncbi:MAG: hypothetical protein ACR2LE_08830 [Nocardioidaceae bacterium]